jgi:hypothetical protein
MPTLSVDRVVRVTVNLQPKAAPRRGFGILCAVTSEDVIFPEERLRFYSGLDGVVQDFGLDSPAYKAAQLFYAQTPKPATLALGRWDKDNETPAECVAALADLSADWYGLTFAEPLFVGDHLDVADFIEATSKSRVYFATETGAAALSPQVTDDLPSRLKALGYKRSFCQYSQNPFAVVSAAARAFSVNFNANRSVITLKFKQEPGIVPEGLTETQARALEAKNCNVFVRYDNDTAILQEGVVSNGAFFDEIHGLDWLQNALQTECYNLLYQSKTKIPQTEAGVAQIITTISRVMGEAINNGLVAPGVWNADGFGLLNRGDYLPEGFYIHAQSVDDQPQSEREARRVPPIQVAAKLAGAIHSIDVIVDVNR